MSRLRVALAACFCPAFLLCSLAFAQDQAPLSANKISFHQSSAQPLRIQNDIVAVQVRIANDTVGAEIRYTGLFNIGTPSNQPLLFLFPNDPVSSHVNVRVDGQTYSNDPFRTGARLLTLTAPPVLSDSTIVCVYSAGPIEVRQRLTPKKFSRTTGAILIEYELVNRDGLNAHQAGVLLELDTFINGNDNAQVLTSFGYSRNEQQFDAPAIPDFFQAFQGNLVNPGLVAQGTLVGLNAARPDRLVIGDWSRLRQVQWDYAVPNNTPYGDSAVLLRWNEKTLLPNEVRTVATYYGLGDVTTQTGPLTLHLTALRNLQVNNGQLSPNPFDVNLLVFNNSGATASAVQATLQLPVGLALVSGETATKLIAPSTLNNQFSGTVSWKVIAQCPATDIDLNMSVVVSATPSLSNPVTRAIFLPSCAATLPNFRITAQPDSTVITAGATASFQINMATFNGFNQSAQLSFWPPTVGVTGTFSPTTILPNGVASFNLQTNRNLLAGEYPFIITAIGGGLTRSDSVKVRVRAAAPLDVLKPVLQNPFPANGATDIARDSKISVEVYDPEPSAGLDLNSMRMLVNGVVVALDRVSSGAGYVLTYTHPSAPFRLNEVVNVNVVASDLASPPNSASLAFSFTTQRDLTPPLFFDFNPSRGAREVPLQTKITAKVRDDLAGVDASSIKMLVNAQSVAATITRENNDYRLAYAPPRLRDNDTISVELQAQDLAQPTNAVVEKYSFITVRDSLPPLLLDLQPSANATNVAREVEIRAHVRDDLTGVERNAIRLWVNDKIVSPVLQQEEEDFILVFKPLAPFAFNEVVRVRLVRADRARVPNVDTTNYSFAIVQDRVAPFLTELSPARNASNVPPNMPITFDVRDNGAGVDSSSITLKVNGKIVARALRGSAASYTVSFTPDAAVLGTSDTVHVEVTAADLASPVNTMPREKYFYRLSKDRTPPFTAGHSPAPNSGNVSLESAIALEILDANPGVDLASIKMFVNGSSVTPQFEQRANGYLLRYTPTARWRDNQKVTVKVEAQDLAVPANVMPSEEYSFTIVRDVVAPRARDFSPRPGEINVATNAVISMAVEDDLTGVDDAGIFLSINGLAVAPILTPRANGFLVRYNLSNLVLTRDTVSVQITMRDRATAPNIADFTYDFVTSQDHTPPLLTDFYPPNEARDIARNTDITFQLSDEQTGVDSASVRLLVNGERKAVELSGDPRLYFARYQPSTEFGIGQRVEIAVEAGDRATPVNAMPRRIFHFTTIEPLPDLQVIDFAAESDFKLNQPTKLKAKFNRSGPAIRTSYRLEFRADASVIKDTTIAANVSLTTFEVQADVQFQSGGTHFVEVVVDADDSIKEVNERNNSAQIVAEIVETLASEVRVRPNPFTPNGDMINDVVEFDFSGLNLASPTLHIFDVNGIAIYLTERSTAKRFTWNGRDERGNDVQPGVYLFTLRDRGANVKSGYVVVAR